ncbi:hypothetical protein [Variovorax sp. LjRoot178]|uniref:hypothetical protein n=1 Tax=Variovorax sp. LjRoot178 TaxID=3342277 RepID=UPI003ECE77C8
MTKEDRVTWVDGAALLAGIGVGIATSRMAKVEAFKLLNIVGLTYDLLGIVLLTYVVATSDRFRAFLVNWVSRVAVAATGWFLMSFFIGLALGEFFFGGRNHGLFGYLVPVVVFGMASFYFLHDAVLIPLWPALRDDGLRLKILGGYFLISGIVIQIYAAFLDLWS